MAFSRDEIREKLKDMLIMQDQKYKELTKSMDDSSNLRTDLGLTSIGMIYLVIVIEETFNLRIEDMGLEDFKTCGDMVDYIEKHQK